jgi:type VI secretion system secreted protein VgrG
MATETSPIELAVAGKALPAVEVHGWLGLNQCFRVEALVELVGPPPAANDLLGKSFSLAMQSTSGDALELTGVVTGLERWVVGGRGHVRLQLGPDVAPLGLGLDSCPHLERSPVEVVKDVLQAAGVKASAVRWDLQGSFATQPHTVQRHESDWSFIERVAADAGISYWFSCGDPTVLVFGDDTTQNEPLGSPVPYRDLQGPRMAGAWVSRLSLHHEVAVDSVRLRDYSPEKPALELDQKVGKGSSEREVYRWPGGFDQPSDGKARAQRWLEALQATCCVLRGETGTAEIVPGVIFEIDEHPVSLFNAKYLCTRLEFRAVAHGERALELSFEAVPAATKVRPRPTSRTSAGVERARVVGRAGEEIHTDDQGRVRAQCYWDRVGTRDERASTWMRVGQLPLVGALLHPRVGWEVLLTHLDASPDLPLVVGHLHDGQHAVPYALPDNQAWSAWQTATSPADGTSSEITFQDQSGKEQILIHAARNLTVEIEDGKHRLVGDSHTHEVGGNHEVKVGGDCKLTVGTDQKTTVKGDDSLTVKGSRSVTVKGSVDLTVGNARSAEVKQASTLDIGGDRKVTVGASSSAKAGKNVQRQVLGKATATVGGAWTLQAGEGFEVVVQGKTKEVVGGAKMTVGPGGVTTVVAGDLTETVAAIYTVTAGGDAAETAKEKLSLSVGGAMLATAPGIEIVAESELVLKVGGTSITMKSGEIEVKAPLVAAAAPLIAEDGATVKHN